MRYFYLVFAAIFGVHAINGFTVAFTSPSKFDFISFLTSAFVAALMMFLYYGNRRNESLRKTSAGSTPNTGSHEDDTTQVDIAGESFYQESFIKLFGPYKEDGYHLTTNAVLEREPENRHDSNAIKCSINGFLVGHVNRGDAEIVAANMDSAGLKAITVTCNVAGGWKRGNKDTGMFGAKAEIPSRLLD